MFKCSGGHLAEEEDIVGNFDFRVESPEFLYSLTFVKVNEFSPGTGFLLKIREVK